MPINDKELYEVVHEISLMDFGKPFIHTVRFNSRLRTTGGRYIPSKRVIELNPKYLNELGWDEFIGIIKHELCHYHLHIEGRGYKHGDVDFKRLLKATNSPRHCQPLPSSKQQYKHTYICKSCSHVYKRVRRVNIKKMRCGKCRGKIRAE